MCRQFLIFPMLFVAFLMPTRGWTASTSASQYVMVTPAQTIATITVSNANFTGGTASGTVVGSIDVTMSPAWPPFSGSLSLSGPNASNFQIVGSNLVTNGIDPSGTYSIDIIATDAGIAQSPFTQAETITGTSGSLSACNALTFTYNLVTDFGAAAGNTSATDAALKAFSVEAQKRARPPEGNYPGYPGYYDNANKDNCIVLNIPAGIFKYTWNQYGKFIPHLKIVGAGSGLLGGSSTTLQNVSNTGNFHLDIPYDGALDYFGDAFYVGYDDYGWLINTADAGATSVTLKNASGTSQFIVGRWVLIMSYSQQQFGYPPNMRYYDWAKVTSVNTSTGVITFDRPLTFTHREDRPYYGTTLADHSNNTYSPHGQVGPARIVAIDLPTKPAGVYHEYGHFHILSNPNWNTTALGSQASAGVFTLQGLIDGVTNDVLADNALAMFMLRDHTIANSQWNFDEADKIIRTLTYQNCNVGRTASHSGELLFHAAGGHIGTSNVAARNAIYDGGLLIDGMLGTSGTYSSQGIQLDADGQTISVLINGVTFKGNNDTLNHPIAGPQLGPYTFTIDGNVISLFHGQGTSRLKVQKDLGTVGSTSERMVDVWGDGDAVWKNGVFVSGGTISLITGDANFIYVDVAGTSFVKGDSVSVGRVQSVTVQNNVGQTTGFTWGSPNISWGPLPNIVWTNNSGN